jgi:selenocysteine lyase/cysteine desulfurase
MEGEFPANVYPWMHAARLRGYEFRLLPLVDGLPSDEALLAALDEPGVRAVALSWVGFASGYTYDLERLAAACRDRGVTLVVDAIQGLGPRTLDVGRAKVDILACGGQKWLLSPWGTGFVYVRRELLEVVQPHDVSWMAVRGSDDFTRLTEYDMTWRDDARRYENITLPFQDFAGMNESLSMLSELGEAAVEAHIASLVERVVGWAKEGGGSMRLVTPAEAAHRAGIVAVAPRHPAAASAALRRGNVVHSLREGAIRLAPHCYNTSDEIDRALGIIERA